MVRPRLLDLFCGQGGAARGYDRAGFDVTGVDIDDQPRYPFQFIRADALTFLADGGAAGFDVVHASPPCQAYSVTKATHSKTHPKLVGPVRAALVATGLPYVIENVVGAPLMGALILCGTEFHLTATDDDGRVIALKRHRLFESNVFLMGAGGCCCGDIRGRVGGVYGGGSSDRRHARHVRRGGYTPSKAVRAELLGIDPDAMTLHGQAQAIPPAYTAFIGAQLLAHLVPT